VSRIVDQSVTYPAAKDYWSRDRSPPLAVTWHMAERRDVAQYLSRDPLQGVSVHWAIEQATSRWKDGEVARCLPEDRLSRSINPRTLRKFDDPGGDHGASPLHRPGRQQPLSTTRAGSRAGRSTRLSIATTWAPTGAASTSSSARCSTASHGPPG
jgi:hypothetical protein